MKNEPPIRWGVLGLGGYGREVVDRILAEQAAPNPRAKLVAVHSRESELANQSAARLVSAGVTMAESFEHLLSREIDAVWLPVPIDLHREFTEAALRAGKAVLCEKPAAGAVQDVDAMIAARNATGELVAIGYQDVYQPAVWELKRRLLRGDFGVILSASVLACWPRGESYYHRNEWAGRMQRGGRWVLDSPANNAIAHYLHLAQFLLGPTESSSAVPSEVEAELYRANDIENYDTCSMRLTFDNGAHLVAGLTHACSTNIAAQLVIRTQGARICYRPGEQIETHTQSVTESIPLSSDRQGPILDAVQKWLTLGPDAARVGTLEMARAHTVAINAASEAASIANIPDDQIETIRDGSGGRLRAVRGIEDALAKSVADARMLHETGLVPWSRPGGDISIRAYMHFLGPKSGDAA